MVGREACTRPEVLLSLLEGLCSMSLRPLNAALRRVKEFGIEKRISDRPHAMLWLFKTYALSAGMYASQVYAISEA